MSRPTGSPANWTPAEWGAYNAWEAAQAIPPMFGPYENATQYYSSEEWLTIVRNSLGMHELHLQILQGTGRQGDIDAIKIQIEACRRELGLTPPPQLSLFNPDPPFPEVCNA